MACTLISHYRLKCHALPTSNNTEEMSDEYGSTTPCMNSTNTAAAVIEGDPVDVAIELGITISKPDQVALVNMANDKRAGGDWEAGESPPSALYQFPFLPDDMPMPIQF